jgi:hypothetical protein
LCVSFHCFWWMRVKAVALIWDGLTVLCSCSSLCFKWTLLSQTAFSPLHRVGSSTSLFLRLHAQSELSSLLRAISALYSFSAVISLSCWNLLCPSVSTVSEIPVRFDWKEGEPGVFWWNLSSGYAKWKDDVLATGRSVRLNRLSKIRLVLLTVNFQCWVRLKTKAKSAQVHFWFVSVL